MKGFRQPPRRHWRSYGNDPLPTPAEAMAEPFSAFPSWFMRNEGPLPPGGHRRPACRFRHQGLAAPSTMYVRNFPALSRSGASASAAFA